MGCDIHMNVEVRRGKRWRFVEPPTVKAPYYTNGQHKTWWDDRDYSVFSALAGVRADKGDPPPVDQPRGYPADVDPETMNQDYPSPRGQDHGDHSASWLTLDEVFAYDWAIEYQETGVVTIDEYVRCSRDGDTPREWSRWVSGGNVKVLAPETADAWLRTTEGTTLVLDGLVNGTIPHGASGDRWVEMEWTVTLSDRCASFLTWVRGLPATLGKAPEDIRLVFSFDS